MKKNQHPIYGKLLSPFIKSITVYDNDDSDANTTLPFYADGFPGLMYHETPNGLFVLPHQKCMPPLFLYGQTLEPIEFKLSGSFQLIVFQLHPFALKSLFHINPTSINNSCYDLAQADIQSENDLITSLSVPDAYQTKIKLLTDYIASLIEWRKKRFDGAIYMAIKKILVSEGKCNMAETAMDVNLTPWTFKRRFLSETGLTPKQFAKIIQFDRSLSQLSAKDYSTLTDIAYQNGFADQSHFIRVFKSFTRKTPKQLKGKT